MKEMDNKDFYIDENKNYVMTENFHLKRGFCCGNGCKHCPYIPKHTKGNKNIKNEKG